MKAYYHNILESLPQNRTETSFIRLKVKRLHKTLINLILIVLGLYNYSQFAFATIRSGIRTHALSKKMFVNLLLDLHKSRNVNLTDLRMRDISLPVLFREPTTNFMKISACYCHFIYRLSSLRSRGDKVLCMFDCSRRHILALSCLSFAVCIISVVSLTPSNLLSARYY